MKLGELLGVSLMRVLSRRRRRRGAVMRIEDRLEELEAPLEQQCAPQPEGRLAPALSCAVKISFNFRSF